MRILEVSKQSQLELIEIRRYTTTTWGALQSDKYLSDLYNSMNLLKENPFLGFNKTELSRDIYSFPHMSHLIFYKFDIERLYIMAVLHKNMLPKEQLQGRI